MKVEITQDQKEKLASLKGLAASWKSCVIAYSGGVDSTFLLAVIATSATYPKREYADAIGWLNETGIKYKSIV